LGDAEAEEIFLFEEFAEAGLGIGEGKAAAAGDVGGGKLVLGDDVEVEVEHEFAGIGMELHESVLRGGGCAL